LRGGRGGKKQTEYSPNGPPKILQLIGTANRNSVAKNQEEIEGSKNAEAATSALLVRTRGNFRKAPSPCGREDELKILHNLSTRRRGIMGAMDLTRSKDSDGENREGAI